MQALKACSVNSLRKQYFILTFNTLPPSPSLEAAEEATTIDQCYHSDNSSVTNCRPNSSAFSLHSHALSAPSTPPSVSALTNLQQPPVSGTTAATTTTQTSNLSTSAPPCSPRSSNVLIGLDHIFTSFLMKMEVLSVQNHHIQKQFDVLGSTNVKKDWTSSLTPPASRTPPTPAASTAPSSTTLAATNHYPQYHHSPIEHFDVVDGLKPQHNTTHFNHSTTTTASTHQHNHRVNMETATAASASPKSGIESAANAHYAYNNNLLYCAPNAAAVASVTGTSVASTTSYHPSPLSATALSPSPVSSNLSTPTEATEHYGIAHDDDVDAAAVNELSQRLQAELRAAKSRHLSCTEVSLPWDLTPRIAADMIKTSEREPCGVRGCAIFIDFEDETGSARRIASFKVDPNTVSTFELFLTLKQAKGGWTSLLPQFLKNLTRSSTILISPHFTLSKHKLYACE